MNLTGALKETLLQREKQILCAPACLSEKALRRSRDPLEESDYRLPFSVDADRILNAMAYARYADKTQVFSLIRNDHLTHRILHVQMVSRVARTIGRYLMLNTDLIEAASLGHDIGHPPFGHDGEGILSELTCQAGIGPFRHNLSSVQFLDRIERRGKGWNLSLPTLDAILCHNGEAHAQTLTPSPWKGFEGFDELVSEMKADPTLDPMPMTLEGCVVRAADTISYIGRDLEDAIRLKLITRDQAPCADILGNTQGTIVFNLVTDLIKTSAGKPFIAFSPEVAQALGELKTFNYDRIYKNPAIKRHLASIRDGFKHLFQRYMEDLAREDRSSVIYTEFLDGLDGAYIEDHTPAEMVRDFIAGMTDAYFIRKIPDTLRPRYIDHV